MKNRTKRMMCAITIAAMTIGSLAACSKSDSNAAATTTAPAATETTASTPAAETSVLTSGDIITKAAKSGQVGNRHDRRKNYRKEELCSTNKRY